MTSGLSGPEGIALDVADGKMYFVDNHQSSPFQSSGSKIQRANLDGTGVEDLVTSGLAAPKDIALDVAGRKVYWTDFELKQVTLQLTRVNSAVAE